MIDAARGRAARVAVLAAALAWLAAGGLALAWLSPGLALPAAAAAARVTEEIVEQEYDGCTFRLVNRYAAGDRTQQALTRQVRTEECRFGARNRTIRVRVCFEGPDDATPVDCSPWLRPTADAPYAESEITSLVPKGSIHYVEIRGEVRSFPLPPSEPAPAPPPPAPTPAPPPPPPPPVPETTPPTPTAPATGEPSPAPGEGDERVESREPEPPETAAGPPRPQTRAGLAAALATGGLALLGLGGTTIWLLRRGGFRTG